MWSTDTLKTYRKLYCPYNSVPAVIGSHGWVRLNHLRYIKLVNIEEHLKGKYVFGRFLTKNNTKLRFFCLDFDYDTKNYKTIDEFHEFVKGVIDIFPTTGMVIQSSSSEGIHVYYYVKPEYQVIIHERVVGTLRNFGYNLCPGQLELYTGGQALRLPFGIGSYELDSKFNRLPRTTLESIKHWSNIGLSKDLPNIYDITPAYKFSKIGKEVVVSTTDRSEIVELLEGGLPYNRSFHTSTLKVVVHLFEKIKDPVELKEEVIKWLHRSHNYKSETYFNSDKLCRELDGIITWVIKKNYTPLSYKFFHIPRNACDFVRENFCTYTQQKAVFNLFQCIARQLISAGRVEGNVKFIKLGKRYLLNKDIAIGLNSRNYLYILNKLVDLEIIKLSKAGNSRKAHCNYYEWIGPDLFESEGKCYNDFSLYLKENKYLTLYSPYLQRVINKDIIYFWEYYNRHALQSSQD